MIINTTWHEYLPNAIISLAAYLRKKYGPEVCITPSATAVRVEFTGGGPDGSGWVLDFATTADGVPFGTDGLDADLLGRVSILTHEITEEEFGQLDELLDCPIQAGWPPDSGTGLRGEKHA